ncbi:hypothetical protein ACFP4H_10335 [Pseudophaeobacter arcticus]|uniref:hypothetical protein n=1 Tax=Pseudophaeobacter arcticus TaxID=385492 RepID=UPI0004019FA6|nr:hypothetical protein [Pseudophaeobacter arcticus]
MSRSLALFAIGLTFGCGIGFVVAAGNGITFTGHDHGDPAQHGGAEHQMESAGHAHSQPLMITPGSTAPKIAIDVHKDPMSGWNLQVTTENFIFSPEHVSTADRPGEGHAHVYINGSKLTRLYGNWLHLGDLPKGSVEITVGLNANSHSPLMIGTDPIADSVIIDNP